MCFGGRDGAGRGEGRQWPGWGQRADVVGRRDVAVEDGDGDVDGDVDGDGDGGGEGGRVTGLGGNARREREGEVREGRERRRERDRTERERDETERGRDTDARRGHTAEPAAGCLGLSRAIRQHIHNITSHDITAHFPLASFSRPISLMIYTEQVITTSDLGIDDVTVHQMESILHFANEDGDPEHSATHFHSSRSFTHMPGERWEWTVPARHRSLQPSAKRPLKPGHGSQVTGNAHPNINQLVQLTDKLLSNRSGQSRHCDLSQPVNLTQQQTVILVEKYPILWLRSPQRSVDVPIPSNIDTVCD